jgi:O-succinylbenzoic acid--CoA ligase
MRGPIVTASLLHAPRDEVWATISTFAGINDEFRPLFRMTAPMQVRREGLAAVDVGQRVCRSWVLLFGLLPVDYDDITLVSLVPTMLARLLDAGLARPPALRCALLGGAGAPPPLLERAQAAGVPVAQTYGLTEAASQVTTSPPGDPSTVGVPLLPTRVAIAADGEVLVAGPTVSPSALGPDGWLHTGDLGSLDARGRLTITGRKADTIVTGGENVAPAEVEAVLETHPSVAEAAVHGRPDPEWGEAIVAVVRVRDDHAVTEAELRAHCALSLARFKLPKTYIFADAPLPRTGSGKLLRRELTI